MQKKKIERLQHKEIFGEVGEGQAFTILSLEVSACLVPDGVKFIKKDQELILTKEELINEFKIGLNKGYFKKEDLFDEEWHKKPKY